MAQIFHPSANAIAKGSIFGAVFIVLGALFVTAEMVRSSYVTEQNDAIVQPVQFSHEHHVKGLGIDCRYCHTSVEHSAFAGIPPTKTCMTCHSQVWTNAPILEPVRQSWRDDTPIRWTRVHDLPDFVQFNHSIHVQKGIG
ncbi:MAG TPA: cytochrome c3 family protein, partial [Tepidisphaeraceae bacterium]|nr:cytochrome c3 family protein [Tepidisphaeraceae bacterium]